MSDADKRTSIMGRGKLVNGLNLRLNVEDDETPWRKIAQQQRDERITDMADFRQEHCWLCRHRPDVWVREVVFDLGGKEEMPVRKSALAVDSEHFPGPVPGFCAAHLGAGPKQLAETVYNMHEVVAWGFRPTRWFVIFTDGSMMRGSAVEIDPMFRTTPETQEAFTHGES